MSSLTEEQRQRIEANRQRALAIRRAKLAEAAAKNSTANIQQNANYNKPQQIAQNNINITKPGQSSNFNSIPKNNVSSQNTKSNLSPFYTTQLHSNSGKEISTISSLVNSSSKTNFSNEAIQKSSIFGTNSLKQPSSPKNISKPTPVQNGPNISSKNLQSSSFYGTKQSNNNVSTASDSDSGSGNSGNSCSSVPPKKVFTGKALTGTFSLTSEDRFVAEVGYHQVLIDIFKTMPSRKYEADTRRWNFSLSDHNDLAKKVKTLRPEVCISPLPDYVIKVLKDASSLPPLESVDLTRLDPRLHESLLPFQRDGVRFGLRREGRVLIADDMGLGKTIQALAIAAFYRSEWPLLVVTPSSVRYSWENSLKRWLTACSSNVINTCQDSISGSDVIITSYDLLSRRGKEFTQVNFGVIIMDESHMMKNFKSARYKAAAPLMKKAKRVILLSGTPALSRPSELYTQIASVDPKLFPNYQNYGIRYCAGKMGNWGWDFNGSSNLQELQVILQSKIMIRRLKSEVLSQLPSKRRQVVILDPASISNNSSKELISSAQQLGLSGLKGADRHSALLQFFAQTSQTKLKAVSDYVKELMESGEKFLVFAHHRVMIENLCRTCEKQKVMYIRIEGSTPGDTRQALVDEFQNRKDVKVAVLSITAASTGITLTAASLVVFAELYWNPGILVQAEDRVHRLGQEDCVSVHYLVAQGTADDHIWPMVQQKLNILGKAGLSGDDFSNSNSTFQKSDEKNSIMQYLVDMSEEEMREMEQEYDGQGTTSKEEDIPDDDALPVAKKLKLSHD